MTKRPGGDKRFAVIIHSGPDETYGFELEEATGPEQTWVKVARIDAKRARRLLAPLMEAVRSSGHPKTVLHPGQRDPIILREQDGVRLALTMITTGPITKARRIDAMISGIAAMTTEEAYYWYAKTTGPDASRRRRALRLFLAEDSR
jgi:hypothetical protein